MSSTNIVSFPQDSHIPEHRRVRYCSSCGHRLSFRIAPGEYMARPICDGCGAVHYINPNVVVGCVAEDSVGRILMCQRRLNPRGGYWTFPSGFLECGESVEEGAKRETFEEAQASVQIDGLLCLIDIPQISEVHLVFRGTIESAVLAPTAESLTVALFAEDEIPWKELAFTSIGTSLRLYFDDRRELRKQSHILDHCAAI